MTQTRFIPWKSILAFVTFSFGVLICQYTGNRGVFPIDSFSHFDIGYRILNGEHAFKDFWIVSGFFVDYLQSFIFYLFGTNWQTYLLNASLLNGCVTLLFYFLLNNLGLNFKLSFFYAICFSILAYPSSGTPFVDHHSTFLSLIAVLALIKALQSDKLIYWFLIPIFLFFAFLSKQVPSSYIFFSVLILITLHFTHQEKNNLIKIFLTLLCSSLLMFFCLFIFFKINEIEINLFITQYFKYPNTIGLERYADINYNLKNVFLDFKFIYLALFFLVFLTFNNLKIAKNFSHKNLHFKILIICLFLFLSFAQHTIVTKNQIFIYFLIPLFLGLASIQLNLLTKSFKNYLNIFFVIFCLVITIKYHYRFNIERKFHELQNIPISQAVNSNKLNEKFEGLKWITPNSKNKEDSILEIKLINNFKDILKQDQEEKIVLTNYSFFSVISNQNIGGFSRWYPGDNSAFPNKGNLYFKDYKDLIIKILEKRNIKSIYILPDINENNLINYIDPKCFDRQRIEFEIIKYVINNKCNELFLWKKN